MAAQIPPNIVTLEPPQAGEQSVEELAESMSEKEFRALVILMFRQQRRIYNFVVNAEEALAGMGENGGMMGKLLASTMPAGFIPPPPPKLQQSHPHTNGPRRR